VTPKQDPKGILIDLLETQSDTLGWFEESLISAAAEAVYDRDIEGSIKVAQGALKELLDKGVVLARTIDQNPSGGRMVSLG